MTNNKCFHEQVMELGYTQAIDDAARRTKRGEYQKLCPTCGLWIWSGIYLKRPIESGKPYWLIERGQAEGSSQPVWWRGEAYDIGIPFWTTDARYALKWDTKEEAEEFKRGFSDPVRVTEHLFA